jgi:hypothetical protein
MPRKLSLGKIVKPLFRAVEGEASEEASDKRLICGACGARVRSRQGISVHIFKECAAPEAYEDLNKDTMPICVCATAFNTMKRYHLHQKTCSKWHELHKSLKDGVSSKHPIILDPSWIKRPTHITRVLPMPPGYSFNLFWLPYIPQGRPSTC